jgi:hypothetical protein
MAPIDSTMVPSPPCTTFPSTAADNLEESALTAPENPNLMAELAPSAESLLDRKKPQQQQPLHTERNDFFTLEMRNLLVYFNAPTALRHSPCTLFPLTAKDTTTY